MLKRKPTPPPPDYSQCPFLASDCIRQQCALWVHLSGTDPQTGNAINEGMCAIAANVKTTLDVGRGTMLAVGQLQAARNEADKRHAEMPPSILLQSAGVPLLPRNGAD